MKKNTAKTTDPIWDSRNSDEPDYPAVVLAKVGFSPAQPQKPHSETLAEAQARADRAKRLLALAIDSWGKQVESLRNAYVKLRNSK